MSVLSTEEVMMLRTLLARAGVNNYEAAWANSIINRLLEAAEGAEKEKDEKPRV